MRPNKGRISRECTALLLSAVLLCAGWSSASAAAPVDAPSAVDLARQDAVYEKSDAPPGKSVLSTDDEKLLDEIERRGVQFFVDEADPVTGLMPDRGRANGGAGDVASIASVGFGLTALCIGDERGWVAHQDAYDRSLRVLKFLHEHGPQSHGHFYHFLDMHTGQRVWNCEVSNIDTALLMAGALTVRQHFPNTELAKLADQMYKAVDWPWLMHADGILGMGWKPETGFIDASWNWFNEGSLVYLLALGSPTHPIPPRSWSKWRREPVMTYAGLTFIQCPPLFTQQYPQVWFDLRGQRDDFADYFRNSQLATLAQRQWCMDELSRRFSGYGPNMWGISSSDSAQGYKAWGGPPEQGEVDGTVVPCAAAGSLVFQPRLCVDALRAMRDRFGEKCFSKYGFIDSFNPTTSWYNPDVLGIDIGPSVAMAENCRTGFVWTTFMSCAEAKNAVKLAGFRALSARDNASCVTSVFGAAAPSVPGNAGK
jgi:hypothetical protein